jgi:hypothetical protein
MKTIKRRTSVRDKGISAMLRLIKARGALSRGSQGGREVVLRNLLNQRKVKSRRNLREVRRVIINQKEIKRQRRNY